MITYNDKVLIKYKSPKSDKEHREIDGFYQDEKGIKYFIEKPIEGLELFNALDAGKSLTECMALGLVNEQYHSSLECTDVVKLEDGSYGFIRPVVMYQGKELIKYKNKGAGKNRGEMDGFYVDEDGTRHFIKKPSDKNELFTELFAGLLLKEFMRQGLIDEKYHPSLICADVLDFGDHSYGLIQPVISFTELFKIIDTGNRQNSDRDPFIEMLSGPSYYPALTKGGNYFGLSSSLMFSLLLGAQSVHSGNMVVLDDTKSEILSRQFARLDWGDAFRYFGHPENNADILKPFEYAGFFNMKAYTKGYVNNYKKIKGLFPAMAEKAREFKKQIEEIEIPFNKIVANVLKQLPADLLDMETKKALAKYMCISAFETASFGPEGTFEEFAEKMSEILENRLKQVTELTDPEPSKHSDFMHRSIIEYSSVSLKVEEALAFPDLLKEWRHTPEHRDITVDETDLSELINKFNYFVDSLAQQAQLIDLWEHNASESSANIFALYHEAGDDAINGTAFVSQCHESTVLRRLFMLEEGTLCTPRQTLYENITSAYKKENDGSAWAKIDNLLSNAFNVLTVIKTLQDAPKLEMDIETIKIHEKNFRKYLASFSEAHEEMAKVFASKKILPSSENVETSFYPIDDESLEKMSGDQLVSIALEEINYEHPTPLLLRIFKSETLWQRINVAFNSGAFDNRTDQPREKFVKLNERRKLLLPFLEVERELEQHKAKLVEAEKILVALQEKKTTVEEELKSALAAKKKLSLELENAEQNAIETIEMASQLKELQHQIDDLSQQKKDAESDLDLKVQENQILLHRVKKSEQLASKLPDAIQFSQKQETQIQELEKALEQLKQEKESLASELGNVQEELQQQKTKNDGLVEEIEHLSKTPKPPKTTDDTSGQQVKKLVRDLEEAEKKYQQFLARNKVALARAHRAAPVLAMVQDIELKAKAEFKDNSEAYNHAMKIVKGVRKAVEDYQNNPCDNERKCLEDFKKESEGYIDQHKAAIEAYPGWKYVLGNLALAIGLVGVGYLAVAAVNKLTTGKWTFFQGTTQSSGSVEKLKEIIKDPLTFSGRQP